MQKHQKSEKLSQSSLRKYDDEMEYNYQDGSWNRKRKKLDKNKRNLNKVWAFVNNRISILVC